MNMESEISQVKEHETSDYYPEVTISEHQCSKKYLLSMLQDSPLENDVFSVPKSLSNKTDITDAALKHEDTEYLPPIIMPEFQMPSGSQNSASELMHILSQAAYIESLSKQCTPVCMTNNEPLRIVDVANESCFRKSSTLVKEKKDLDVGEDLEPPKKRQTIGSRCNCKLSMRSKKFHCNEITEDDRLAIFTAFWKKMNWNQRKIYISTLVKCSYPKTRRKFTLGVSRKEFAFEYHLKKSGRLLRVCKVMFLSTFNLGEFSVRDWVLNKIEGFKT